MSVEPKKLTKRLSKNISITPEFIQQYIKFSSFTTNSEQIVNFLIEKLISYTVTKSEKNKVEAQLPEVCFNFITDTIDTYIEQYVTNNVKDGVNSTVENTAGIVAEKVVAVGVAILLFIIIRVALLLLKFIAEGLAELPILKQFNKMGGTIYGAFRGIVFVYILLAICFFVVSVSDSGVVTNVIDSSLLTKFLYTNNLILNIIF